MASSPKSNSLSRTSRLKAVFGTFTSANWKSTSDDDTSPFFRAIVFG